MEEMYALMELRFYLFLPRKSHRSDTKHAFIYSSIQKRTQENIISKYIRMYRNKDNPLDEKNRITRTAHVREIVTLCHSFSIAFYHYIK